MKLMETKTSLTEFTGYPFLCERAVNDNKLFESFRSQPECLQVVETVDYRTGKECLDAMRSQSPEFIKLLDKFRSSEQLGSPLLYGYRYKLFSPRIFFSPTTLRYIKILSDLKNYFGSLDGMKIIEIGVGYGGQCKIVSDVFGFDSYTIVDLKPVLNLTKNYLDYMKIKNVIYCTIDDLANSDNYHYDLIISNYAFSEITREIQDFYIEEILNKSSRGYMLCNFKTHGRQINSYTELDLINRLSHSVEIFQQKPPLTNMDISCSISLVVWGLLRGAL